MNLPTKITIAGVTYTIEYTDDKFVSDCTHFGEIDFVKSKILINKELSIDMINQTLMHEIVHAMLISLGQNEINEDEIFVQSLALLISQCFDIKQSIINK